MQGRWRIELFGGLRAEGAGRVITRFQTQRTGVLLAYLACHLQARHPREMLIELLWPECEPAAGRARLSTALSSLRRQLEPPGVPAGSIILADRTQVGLNPAAVTTDVAEFHAALRAAARARSGIERAQYLAEAVERYRVEFLTGYNETWVLEQQGRLAEAYFQALDQLLAYLEQTDELDQAVELARGGVNADPLREEAQHQLIRLLAAAGQPAAALRQFDELKRILKQELDAAPAPATCALARQIREQRPTVGPSSLPAVPPRPTAPFSRRAAPTGTVTWLLAEIELPEVGGGDGQEARAETPTRWRARRQRLLRRHNGFELKAGSASFSAAFERASDALACALGIRRSSAALRIALHTGEVRPEKSPRGLLLQDANRLLAAAHPGQILLSEATAALLAQDQGVTGRFTDLGLYRLLDRASPGRLYQVDDPAVSPRCFPPVNAPPAYAQHLPVELTRFFGREDEMVQLAERLEAARLITLTGPAGIGKTRLALETARRLTETYRGAVWFVPLDGLSDPLLIPDRVVGVLRLPRSPDAEPMEQVSAFFSRQPGLLLLDNFEHLVAEGAPLIYRLLGRAPMLTLLVTSRQRLDLSGEHEFPVRPLPIPVESLELRVESPASAGNPELSTLNSQLSTLMQCPSVRLFVDRAQAVRPDFQLTTANSAAVSAVCIQLEGLPLALELAAARAWVLTPAQVLERLTRAHEAGGRFSLLTGRQRNVNPRHHSLQAALDWGYQLLSPELQRFFARLSVFRGGWTLDAAEAVCEEPKVLEYLERLRECSLVLAEETAEGPWAVGCRPPGGTGWPLLTADSRQPTAQTRFRMLEALREYAARQLTPEEQDALARQHAIAYLALAELAEPALRGPDQGAWLKRLEQEHDNLRAALDWCREVARGGRWSAGTADRGDGPDQDVTHPPSLPTTHCPLVTGLRLGASLWVFWKRCGFHREGSRRLGALLALDGAAAPPELRALVLRGAGVLALDQGRINEGRTLLEESLALCGEIGDRLGTAWSIGYLGHVSFSAATGTNAGNSPRLIEESLAIFRDLGHRSGVAFTLGLLGNVAQRFGEWESAGSHYEEGLEILQDLGDCAGVAQMAMNLGHMARAQGHWEAARARYDESLAIFRRLGDRQCVASALQGLGNLARAQGLDETAQALLGESLSICRELSLSQNTALLLANLGLVAQRQGDWAAARNNYEESLALFRELQMNGHAADALMNLGAVARGQGDPDGARTHYGEALSLYQKLGDGQGIAFCLMDLAEWSQEVGQPEQAARWFGAAQALHYSAGLPLAPGERGVPTEKLAALRAELGGAAFAAAWSAGQALTCEHAAAEALGALAEPGPGSCPMCPEGGLHCHPMTHTPHHPG